jgi:4-amino-4-deoxy-L-arabinose transferase-like glycosyltransferase
MRRSIQQETFQETYKENRRLGMILLSAFILRLLVVFVFFATYKPTDDASAWQESAENVVAGRGFSTKNFAAYRTPIPALYLAAVYSIFGVSVRAAQIANAVLGTLTVWLIFEFLRKDFGVEIARWGALFAAIYPTLLFYTGQLLSETPILLFTALALRLTQVFRDRPVLWFIPVGIDLGLAVLTREPFFATAVLIAMWLVLGRKAQKGWTGLARATVLLVCVVLTLVPWTVRNYLVFGKVIPISTRGGYNFWLANRIYTPRSTPVEKELTNVNSMSEADQDKLLWKLTFRFIFQHPLEYLKLSLFRLAEFWHLGYHGYGWWEIVFLAGYFPFLALAIVGSFLSWRDNREVTLLLLTVPISLSLVHMMFVPEGRYRLPIDMVLCMFAGFTTHHLFRRFLKTQRF